mgnify:CR=1 FL=1
MRFALRVKLSVLVTLVALLPMLAATITIVLGLRFLRIESFGQKLSSVVEAEARVLRISLIKDIAGLRRPLNEPSVARRLAAIDEPLPVTEWMQRDSVWKELPNDDPRIRAVTEGDLPQLLRLIRRTDPRLVELIVTDRHGQLVAATGRTSDFYQGDEFWWEAAFAEGQGRVYVPPIRFDDSAEAWVLELCLPILHRQSVVGVAKVSLSASSWLGVPVREVGGFSSQLALVAADGERVFRPGQPPLPIAEVPWAAGARARLALAEPWWRSEEGLIVGASSIALPDRVGALPVTAPGWTLLLSTPRAGPLSAANRLTAVALGVGLSVTAAVFVMGLLLVRRIVGRVRRVQLAAHEVAEGDLTHRIRSFWGRRRLLGRDEIDDLVDDFNRMVQRVETTQSMLQAANELKSRFIKIASHELRTPVSYLMAMASLLQRSEDPQKLRDGVKTMGQRAQRLNDIIQAMFKLLPEQAYGEELEYSTFAVSDLLEEVYGICRPFLEQRHQRLVIETEPALPEIQADRGKLRDVLENLVTNAIKFTPDGGRVLLKAGEQLGGYVAISVADQGPGIPQEELPHLFEPFYSGGDVLRHSTGDTGYRKSGMGLGLAIVRHFVHLHGGNVNVHSSEEGTTFTLSIPLSPPSHRERPEAPK